MAIIAEHHALCFAFGLMGNILSFMVYLAPLPTFYRVYQKKSTEGFQSIPYVVALFSAMLWLYYGFLKADGSMLITINTIGCTIETIYIIMYLIYAPKGAKIFTVKLLLLLNVGAFGLILIFTLRFTEGLKRVTILGWVNSVLAVSVFAAPLTIMRLVIRTKSVEFMPLSLSFFLTLCAVMWFFYGLMMKDYFIALPNILGFLFGIVQMILYIIYKGAKDAKTNVVPKLQLPELVLDVDLKTIDDPKVQPSENQPVENATNKSNEPVEPSECNV